MRIENTIYAKEILAGDTIPGGILVVVVGGQQLDNGIVGVANPAEISTCVERQIT